MKPKKHQEMIINHNKRKYREPSDESKEKAKIRRKVEEIHESRKEKDSYYYDNLING